MCFVILPLKPKSFLFGFVNRKGIFAIKEEKQAIMRSFVFTGKTEQKAPCFDDRQRASLTKARKSLENTSVFKGLFICEYLKLPLRLTFGSTPPLTSGGGCFGAFLAVRPLFDSLKKIRWDFSHRIFLPSYCYFEFFAAFFTAYRVFAFFYRQAHCRAAMRTGAVALCFSVLKLCTEQ